MSETADGFLDVPRLLESSRAMPRPRWPMYLLLSFAVLVMTTSLASGHDAQLQILVRSFGAVAMFGIVIALWVFSVYTVKQQRREQQRVEAIEELVQLRRWDQAAAMLDAMLSQPARSPAVRLQALIYLAGVLARYHRFGDAITVQNYLLEHAELDPVTGHGLKLMRAMSMLHEDHLFDADRAISDLRREAPDSAGLTLVEIYRDIKTGHPAEAIELFDKKSAAMRAQLGHRIADAYALIARAYDLLDHPDQAAAAFEKATVLAPAEDLYRRYPELAPMRDRYPAAHPPKEAA